MRIKLVVEIEVETEEEVSAPEDLYCHFEYRSLELWRSLEKGGNGVTPEPIKFKCAVIGHETVDVILPKDLEEAAP